MPSPTPAPNAAEQLGNHVNSITQHIPGIDRLPDYAQPIVLGAIDLFLLFVLFQVLKSVIDVSIQRWTAKIAAREEKDGDRARAARLRTLTGLTTSILVFTTGLLLALTALSVIGVNTNALIGTVSVAGIAFGFGAQKVAKDVITGFIILFENQYAVGDYVTINGISGTVLDLAMRTTEIRDDDGKLYILSNGDIAQVCNQSRGPVSGSFEIAIASGADLQKAQSAIDEALAKDSETLHLDQAAHVAGITSIDAAKTVLKVVYRTPGTIRPGSVALQLRETARKALMDAEIPLGTV